MDRPPWTGPPSVPIRGPFLPVPIRGSLASAPIREIREIRGSFRLLNLLFLLVKSLFISTSAMSWFGEPCEAVPVPSAPKMVPTPDAPRCRIQNDTWGTCRSFLVSSSKNCACMNPKAPPTRFVGKRWSAVLYWLTELLKTCRAEAIWFSVTDSSCCEAINADRTDGVRSSPSARGRLL